MSIEINTIILGGNLVNDVVLKTTSGGQKLCTFTIASNRTFMKNNVKSVETSFIDVDVWGASAQNCSQYLQKGSPVVVTGRIKQDRWETEKGEKRNRLKIVAANVQFLPSNRKTPEGRSKETIGEETAWDE